jgi:hypothetical protein
LGSGIRSGYSDVSFDVDPAFDFAFVFDFDFDFVFEPRFHAFGVPHSSPVLGRVGVLTYGCTVLSLPGAPLFAGYAKVGGEAYGMRSFATSSRDFQDSDKVFGRL